MTRKEMTEIFTVMSLAWPNAEMFKGGVERLGPTITLWTSCLPDVDFWTAKQAVVKLCRECKFPPTIAEMKEAAEAVHKDIEAFVRHSFERLKTGELLCGSLAKYVSDLPGDCPLKIVIKAMGGTDALVERWDGGARWNYEGFKNTYTALIRKDPALVGGVTLALPGRGKERV